MITGSHGRTPVLYGCSSTKLSSNERAFFRDQQPLGLILFARNIENPDQVKALTDSFCDLMDGPTMVAIDQEGGRVVRLPEPFWRQPPAMKLFGDMEKYDPVLAESALKANCQLIAMDLQRCGINTNCAPVLDVPIDAADTIIGDRAFSQDPAIVAELGKIAVDAFWGAGVLPVIKHLPGHGRALVDSHKELPVVDAALDDIFDTDLLPFMAANLSPLAMTAHVTYPQIDPDNPATLSAVVIGRIIRMKIGFSGLLLSDDISMGALSGDVGDRAARALQAGCDIVTHCNGNMPEMQAIAGRMAAVEAATLDQFYNLFLWLDQTRDFEYDLTLARWESLLAEWQRLQPLIS